MLDRPSSEPHDQKKNTREEEYHVLFMYVILNFLVFHASGRAIECSDAIACCTRYVSVSRGVQAFVLKRLYTEVQK